MKKTAPPSRARTTRTAKPARPSRRKSAPPLPTEETPDPAAASIAAYAPPADADSAAFATSPLGVLLAVAHDEALPIALRVQAAKAALPFVHRRMPSVNERGGDAEDGAQEEAIARLEAETESIGEADESAREEESACDDEARG